MYRLHAVFAGHVTNREGGSSLQSFSGDIIALFADSNSIVERCYLEAVVKSSNCFCDQFTRVEINTVGGFTIDSVPEFLELALLEVGIKWVLLGLAIIADFRHLTFTEDAIDEIEDLFGMFS